MTPVDEDIRLDAGQAAVRTYPLTGGAVGTGRVVLTLTGPGGCASRMTADGGAHAVRRHHGGDEGGAGAGGDGGARAVARGRPGAAGCDAARELLNIGSIDLPGLLAALDEYPFGCSEQLVSRAMPLIYVEQEARLVGSAAPPDLRFRVQDAVDKLLERQDDDGAFGLWHAGDGEAEPVPRRDDRRLPRARAGARLRGAVPRAGERAAGAERDVSRRLPAPAVLVSDRQDRRGRRRDHARRSRLHAAVAARTGHADAADLRYMHGQRPREHGTARAGAAGDRARDPRRPSARDACVRHRGGGAGAGARRAAMADRATSTARGCATPRRWWRSPPRSTTGRVWPGCSRRWTSWTRGRSG